MLTTTKEKIEFDLPLDIIFAMRGFGKPEVIQKKIRIALALFLFQEGSISLGKATELADMDRFNFIELLQERGIAAYEYTEQDFEWDQEAVVAYHKALQK